MNWINFDRYFVLITANAENPGSQRYEVAKGVKFFKALVANSVYCSFTCVQNCVNDDNPNMVFIVESYVTLIHCSGSIDDKFVVRSALKGSLIQFC